MWEKIPLELIINSATTLWRRFHPPIIATVQIVTVIHTSDPTKSEYGVVKVYVYNRGAVPIWLKGIGLTYAERSHQILKDTFDEPRLEPGNGLQFEFDVREYDILKGLFDKRISDYLRGRKVFWVEDRTMKRYMARIKPSHTLTFPP